MTRATDDGRSCGQVCQAVSALRRHPWAAHIPIGPDDEFVFGLDRILDGVGVLVERMTP